MLGFAQQIRPSQDVVLQDTTDNENRIRNNIFPCSPTPPWQKRDKRSFAATHSWHLACHVHFFPSATKECAMAATFRRTPRMVCSSWNFAQSLQRRASQKSVELAGKSQTTLQAWQAESLAEHDPLGLIEMSLNC